MNFQIMNQINNMDYWSLVSMLMNQITPDIRKLILDRLTKMNDQLMASFTPTEFPRAPVLSSRKKVTHEMPHPSRNYNYSGNPIPVSFNDIEPKMFNPSIFSPKKHQNKDYNMNNNTDDEIDIDDILSDLCDENVFEESEEDILDQKLNRIKKLYNKIVSDKRRRRNK